MKDRIKQIMELTQLTQQDFAARLEISPASLSGIFNGRTNPTNNHVMAIHRAFPKISTDWLLFGEGEMLLPEADGVSADSSASLSDEGAGAGGVGVGTSESGSDAAGARADMSGRMNDLFASVPPSRRSAVSPSVSHRGYSEPRPQSFQQSAPVECVKIIDKPMRKIREIRVFFDDGTYESFVPSAK